MKNVVTQRYSKLLLLLFLLTTSGCAKLFSTEPPAEASATLVGISAEVLTAILERNIRAINNLVALDDYLGEDGNNISAEKFEARIYALRTHWRPKDNPLVNLNIVKVSSFKNSAFVVLQKKMSSLLKLKSNFFGQVLDG